MADLSIVPNRCVLGAASDRTLRLNRRRNKGLYVDTRNGFSSRDRRNFIEQAISITASSTPMTVALVRRRLRKCWSLQDAISTPAPTQ